MPFGFATSKEGQHTCPALGNSGLDTFGCGVDTVVAGIAGRVVVGGAWAMWGMPGWPMGGGIPVKPQ